MALRQAFMCREEYDRLPACDKVWDRIARPVLVWGTLALGSLVILASAIMVDIVFQITDQEWAACQKKRLLPLPSVKQQADNWQEGYLVTEEDAAVFFWKGYLIPTWTSFLVGLFYLVPGIICAYTAPKRTYLLNLVQNACCGRGIRLLSMGNVVFMAVFIVLSAFYSSSILTLETGCSLLLFFSYNVVCWGMAFLHGGTAFLLHRKAAIIMDAGQEEYGSRTIGMELLEPPLSPQTQKRLADGFKSWTGSSSSLLNSSTSEDEAPNHSVDDNWEEENGRFLV